jgi:hypothetical protein
MHKTNALALTLMLVGCGTAKEPPTIPDYGPEAGGGKEDSATRPANTVGISYGQQISAALGDGVNWRAFQFAGNKGQIVDAYAQGLNDTDTVLYLYKISRVTGRPYGKPVGYNDDTDQSGWALQKGQPFNPLSSSIIGTVLPEDRDYALVLTTYQQAGGSALITARATGFVYPSTPPGFAGRGAGTPISFVENQGSGNTLAVLDAVRYPVSTTLQAALTPGAAGLVTSAAVYKAAPDELAAAMNDPQRKADLPYGLLLADPNTGSFDASWTPINRGDAVSELMKAAAPDGDSGLQALVNFVVSSMFKDSAFNASDVDTFRIHWDNNDDTSAEGIAAIKWTTGEIRVLSLDSPP